ncbi:DUF2500 domain-containing protein [Blastopirellula marina]|uniref:Zinc-ribbon domain-containing protein n=1 Tax=Blastopirellula marina DSM 3645 TaxID=314230 RepID=A3ZNP2_9BACT|nr:DUF2500 family protein [Blastopirellula marina]EAQ81940.1 hypothetical protein DSM3645_17350 [Blastopirellula marina DSM 3645]
MKCDNCGGDSSPGASFCQYCGATLVWKSVEELSREQTFAKIRASQQFQQALSSARIVKLPKIHGIQKAMVTIAPLMILLVAVPMLFIPLVMGGIFAVVGFSSRSPWGGLLGIVPLIAIPVPLIAIGVGIYLFKNLRSNMNKMENAPVHTEPVIAVAKRTHISGGGGDHSASTHYYVTFELEDAERREFPVWDGRMYGRIAEQDAGVLFLRDKFAVDFDRVAITL